MTEHVWDRAVGVVRRKDLYAMCINCSQPYLIWGGWGNGYSENTAECAADKH